MSSVVEPTADALAAAATRLRSGGVVAFPTETVYGLGASTHDERALAAVYALKGRPDDNPLIAHVLDADGAQRLTTGWDERCDRLAAAFWPGPLTLVLPVADGVPRRATAGLPTIAVRAPRHDVARDLLEAFGGPISAPSANRSGHVSPTTAAHVAADYAQDDLVVLDGGACAIGLESTVVALADGAPRVLRRGTVSVPMLRDVLGDVAVLESTEQGASPGTRSRHYAPTTPAELVEPAGLSAAVSSGTSRAAVLCFEADAIPAPHQPIEMPQGAGDYGRALYAALRRADAMDVERILIETPPDSNDAWRTVHDRLRRATA